MHLKRVDLLASPDDLMSLLAHFQAFQDLKNLSVSCETGVLRVAFDYIFGVAIPVELTLRVAGVQPERAELVASLRAGVTMPGLVVDRVLRHVCEQSGLQGIRVQEGHLVIDADDLAPELKVWFRFRRLAITHDGIELGLDELVMVPVDSPDNAAAVAMAPPLDAADATPPPNDYRDFYGRLRTRIESFVSEKVPERYRFLLPWVLLLPDLFALLCRLAVDKRVSVFQKVKLGLAIAYVVSPVDFIPDFIPIAGQVDDLGMVLLVLAEFVKETPREVMLENWSGKADIVEVIHGGLQMMRRIAGGLLEKLARHLRDRGGDSGGVPVK